jgi:hypothetical protein
MTSFITEITFTTIHDVTLVDALALFHILVLVLLMAIHLVASAINRPYGAVLERLSLIGIAPMLFSFAVVVLVRLSQYM